ncbi:MAG: AlwI family type II restriction endonuclease [Chloroflexota bacterium]|nr:AlwI family type II restriction endonuclease [Chloroflexota bacterium]
MKKPWSIATAVRNPYRLRDFLRVLRQLDGATWDHESQERYQILLIQNRLYGYGNSQFYSGLSTENIDLLNDLSRRISYNQAEDIFQSKQYEDPPMRGRQSFNPLKKIGLVSIESGNLMITDVGRSFLADDYDFEHVFFRSFLKWQIPNPDNRDYRDASVYNIKPFVGILHLINSVNAKEEDRGHKPKGLSKKEFALFGPTLVHYLRIDEYADRVLSLRDDLSATSENESTEILASHASSIISEFMELNNTEAVRRFTNNLNDYGDNAIRYFRLTRYIYIRGDGYYVDLEPRRSIEIQTLLSHDNAQALSFVSGKEYRRYVSDMSKPELPWETREKYLQILTSTIQEIRKLEATLKKQVRNILEFAEMTVDELRQLVIELRAYRQHLQDEKLKEESQSIEQIRLYIDTLEDIFSYKQQPVLLEKLATLCLSALNDALEIRPNYPVGDDNEPTYTAPANVPDIECFYETFNAICEVTMLTDRRQWYNEGQPVMRHLRDFEDKHDSKLSYCLFIAPRMHRDTLNTFWLSVRYEYEGRAQKIIPLSITNFVHILKVLVQMKTEKRFLTHSDLSRLFDEIINSSIIFNDSQKWLRSIPGAIDSWQESLISLA